MKLISACLLLSVSSLHSLLASPLSFTDDVHSHVTDSTNGTSGQIDADTALSTLDRPMTLADLNGTSKPLFDISEHKSLNAFQRYPLGGPRGKWDIANENEDAQCMMARLGQEWSEGERVALHNCLLEKALTGKFNRKWDCPGLTNPHTVFLRGSHWDSKQDCLLSCRACLEYGLTERADAVSCRRKVRLADCEIGFTPKAPDDIETHFKGRDSCYRRGRHHHSSCQVNSKWGQWMELGPRGRDTVPELRDVISNYL